MKKYSWAMLFMISVSVLSLGANAQYWFQSGVRADSTGANNNGASIEIQTITPQLITNGSMAFWVGDNLPNGAFLQAGYLIENQSAHYPTTCTLSGCTGLEYVKSGDAEWFYEYVPPGHNSSYLYTLGPDGSAGANGTFNRYSFYSVGNTWYFFMNGEQLGSVDLGASSSGLQSAYVVGELADTNTNKIFMRAVAFRNFSVYVNGGFFPVARGYGYIGYGVGSATRLPNPYGVQEVGNMANYFKVGSCLPSYTNNSELWSSNYRLTVASKYANISSVASYQAFTKAALYAPRVTYLNGTARAIFNGWSGTGLGSYTGPNSNVSISVDGNVTETAQWQLQYYVNVSSQEANLTEAGSGWYNDGAPISYGIDRNVTYENSTARFVFRNWSNGNNKLNGTMHVTSPLNLTAVWTKEYFVNVSSNYSNVTGKGWYPEHSIVKIAVVNPVLGINSSERLAFFEWSNGNREANLSYRVDAPINLKASFISQYRVLLVGKNGYGNNISVNSFTINGNTTGNDTFLNENGSYTISGAYYKGVALHSGIHITPTSPTTVYVPLQVYAVTVKTVDIFGIPINASTVLTYDNGSSYSAYSGVQGAIFVQNVPYGYANVTAEYLGMKSRAETANGKMAFLFFASTTDITVIAIAVISGVAVAVAYKRRQAKLEIEKR